jgi:hypothetical protein
VPALGEYANVFDTALAVIRSKGFDLWRDDETGEFWGQRDGWDVVADSPIALLGLVSIIEHQNPAEYAEYWWRHEDGVDFRALPTDPPAYTSVSQ